MATHGGTFIKDGYPLDPNDWPPQFIWQSQYDPFPELITIIQEELHQIFYSITVGLYAPNKDAIAAVKEFNSSRRR